ncbi:MAG: hypothetical protein V7636_2748 [Actinomycetota bacterium]
MITRAYRVLLHLYPRRFRREYGDDMVLLLEDQLRDEGTARVVARAVLDLLLTVPTRHLEAHMKRSSTTAVVSALVALGALLAVIGGPIGLAAGVAAIVVAALTWRRSQPVVAATDTRWWKLLGGGAALFVAEIVVTTITGELPDGWWYVAMVVGLTSLVLMAAGAVLGIATRFARTA